MQIGIKCFCYIECSIVPAVDKSYCPHCGQSRALSIQPEIPKISKWNQMVRTSTFGTFQGNFSENPEIIVEFPDILGEKLPVYYPAR